MIAEMIEVWDIERDENFLSTTLSDYLHHSKDGGIAFVLK